MRLRSLERAGTTKDARIGSTRVMSTAGRAGRTGSPAADAGLGIAANVDGVPKVSQCALGQTITKALPITFAIGTCPEHRESADTNR